MCDPQIENIKEIFPEDFHSECQEILSIIRDIEDAERHNSKLASYINLEKNELPVVLLNHFLEVLKDYDKKYFWPAIHNSADRLANPLDHFLAQWRKRSGRGSDAEVKRDEEQIGELWVKYKEEVATSNNELNSAFMPLLIKNWDSFPSEEYYEIVERYPQEVRVLAQSKRLIAIATLNPEPLRIILKKSPITLLHLVENRRLHHENIFHDPCAIIMGDEEFIQLLLNTPNPYHQIVLVKALFAIDTPRARACAQEVLNSIPNVETIITTPPGSEHWRNSPLLSLSCLPEDRPWLADYLRKNQGLLAEALKIISETQSKVDRNEEYWLSLIRNEDLLSLAMTIYTSATSCSDKVWRNTIKALFPDDNAVFITAKFADTPQNKRKNRIIEAQLLLELGSLLESGNIETVEETILFALGAIPEFFDELGIKLTPLGIELTECCKKSPQGIIGIWTWLNGVLQKCKTPDNVKDNVTFLYKQLKSFHDDHAEQPKVQLFSALHDVDRNQYFGALKNRFSLCLVEPNNDSSLVEQLILASKERILDKIFKFAPETAAKIIERLRDEYPSRFRLEQVLTKDLGWPLAKEGNETFKLLDRLDDDTLPGLLRESLSVLVHSREDLWHRFCYLATFLRNVYPDYPQSWVKAIVPLLDKEKHKELDPEWIRALAICLGFLREPWGNKVPQLLRSMAHDPSLGNLCEDIRNQAAQFNRENFNKGHHRLERRRVDDVKRYLARTSRLVGRNHKIQ